MPSVPRRIKRRHIKAHAPCRVAFWCKQRLQSLNFKLLHRLRRFASARDMTWFPTPRAPCRSCLLLLLLLTLLRSWCRRASTTPRRTTVSSVVPYASAVVTLRACPSRRGRRAAHSTTRRVLAALVALAALATRSAAAFPAPRALAPSWAACDRVNLGLAADALGVVEAASLVL